MLKDHDIEPNAWENYGLGVADVVVPKPIGIGNILKDIHNQEESPYNIFSDFIGITKPGASSINTGDNGGYY